MKKNILTIKDVENFTIQILSEITIFHPDDDFRDYINAKTGQKVYSEKDAQFRNRILNQCFDFCQNKNVDIYNVIMEISLLRSGWSKMIPLPSKIG